jgi:RNA polymerase nonessential primary-like sigma factor
MPASILRAARSRRSGSSRSRLGAHADSFPCRRPITREEEVVLVAKAAAGDQEALTCLFEAHFPLLVRIALTYERPGLEAEDLIGEACVGFTEALSRFEPGHGTRLMTYASWWVRQHVVLALERAKNVRLPRRARAQRGGSLYEVSLSDPPGDEVTISLEELIEAATSTDGGTRQSEMRHDLERALATLPERHRALLRRRFGLDATPEDGITLRSLAGEMGVSRERVRQLEHDALAKMRAALEGRMPAPTNAPTKAQRHLQVVGS